jgi:hypothetical protein
MDAVKWTDIVTALATAVLAVGVPVSAIFLWLQLRVFRKQMMHEANLVGSQAGIMWREQLIELKDRGLSAQQIRDVMLMEVGGEGYERAFGDIAKILKNVPRQNM